MKSCSRQGTPTAKQIANAASDWASRPPPRSLAIPPESITVSAPAIPDMILRLMIVSPNNPGAEKSQQWHQRRLIERIQNPNAWRRRYSKVHRSKNPYRSAVTSVMRRKQPAPRMLTTVMWRRSDCRRPFISNERPVFCSSWHSRLHIHTAAMFNQRS